MNSSHNQHVTATAGGASSVPTPANSGGSGLFGEHSVGATHGEPVNSKSTSTDHGKHRQSQDGGPLFGNISNLKRDSQDANTAQRKQDLAEQSSSGSPGVIGQMWNNLTTGGSKS